MKCPKCGSTNTVKYAKHRGKQRYKCKPPCGYQFIDPCLTLRKPLKKDRDKEQVITYALRMHGVPFRPIAQLFKVSAPTARAWVLKTKRFIQERGISTEIMHGEVARITLEYLRTGKQHLP